MCANNDKSKIRRRLPFKHFGLKLSSAVNRAAIITLSNLVKTRKSSLLTCERTKNKRERWKKRIFKFSEQSVYFPLYFFDCVWFVFECVAYSKQWKRNGRAHTNTHRLNLCLLVLFFRKIKNLSSVYKFEWRRKRSFYGVICSLWHLIHFWCST